MTGCRKDGVGLQRRLGVGDAVVIGLGAMVGAGVFAAYRPAAEAAGSLLLAGLALAGFVAYCNATSSARLAARYPEAGGTYVYGRELLGRWWGFLAGWAFVVGKTASVAAMALTVGAYLAPGASRAVAILAVAAMTGINLLGVTKTVLVTRVILAVVLSTLGLVVVAGLLGGTADPARLAEGTRGGPTGVLRAAGFLFFAFAGYARVATLGGEVVDPARTIPRAVPLALGGAVAVYALVGVVALLALGADALAAAPAPLVAVVEAGRAAAAVPLVRLGAAVAALGVLLSLVAGLSRTVYAMARNTELPPTLAAVHPRTRVPHRAELAVAAVAVAVLLVADLRGAIGFSSFGVLAYYAIANASALRLRDRSARWVPITGLAGCLLLAFALPRPSVLSGLAVLAAGAVVGAVVTRRGR